MMRLNSPYLTQGRNYPKIKFHYKWAYLPEDTNFKQCKFKIDKFVVGRGINRYCCLKYEGHGEDHSNDQHEITKINNSMNKVGITLAWITHIWNEFGERSW